MDIYKQRLETAILQTIDDGFARYKYCEFVKRRRDEAGIICLYGTGKFYRDYVQSMGKYEYVCDRDSQKWGKTFDGHLCISPQQLCELKNVVVFVMLGEHAEVIDELRKYHVEAYFFGDLFLHVYDKHYTAEWFQKNRQEMLDAVDVFEDDISKQIYVDVICNRIAPQYACKTFHQMEMSGEYFGTGILPLGKNEYYVDAGAYNGDSILSFMKETVNCFEKIYGFEMDAINFKMLKSNPYIAGDRRIELFQFGISCEEKTGSIIMNGTGSHITESGQECVTLKSLDNILKDRKITMIKMDIEGAEMDGLEGAKNIISSQHPKLAISVYHKLSDMWEIPQYIKNICGKYKIYLRHHTAVSWDTDCYAFVE